MQAPQKEVPPGDLSLKFMAWDLKELGKEVKAMNKIMEQKMSEIVMAIKELSKIVASKSDSPF